MEKNKEHLTIGKKTFACEICGEEVETEANKEDYLVSDIEGCEVWVHEKCLERAKMLVEVDWSKDY